MGGHTPERWNIDTVRPGKALITDTYGELICTVHGYDGWQEASARRIVASVNAMAGIPVEALEAGCIAELARSLEAIVAMQALRSGNATGTHMSLATLCEFARETLAKIKGEA